MVSLALISVSLHQPFPNILSLLNRNKQKAKQPVECKPILYNFKYTIIYI